MDKTEEAKKLLSEKEEKDKQECGKEIQKVLDKYGCTLDVRTIISTNSIQPRINIIKKK